MTSAEDVEAATSAAERRLGPADILVTPPGTSGGAPVSAFPDDLWARLLAVNLTGTFRFARRVLGPMCARRSGRIVLISSDAAVRPMAGGAGYAASKAAVTALGKVLAIDGGPHGVTCNVISPGIVDTPMSRRRWSREQMRVAVSDSAQANALGTGRRTHRHRGGGGLPVPGDQPSHHRPDDSRRRRRLHVDRARRDLSPAGTSNTTYTRRVNLCDSPAARDPVLSPCWGTWSPGSQRDGGDVEQRAARERRRAGRRGRTRARGQGVQRVLRERTWQLSRPPTVPQFPLFLVAGTTGVHAECRVTSPA